jgi:hypothetical protein
MKFSCSVLFLCFCLIQFSFGQTRTDETTKTVQKVKGDTTITEAVTISQKEDITSRRQMIVINPLKFFLFYNLSYFHMVSPNLAIGGGLQAPTIKDLNGFGVNLEMRFYPSGKTLRGFYLAPNISYNELSDEEMSTEPFSIGILAGWQWFPGDEFAIGLGIGIDYYTGTVDEGNGEMESYNGKVPALRFDIGYAW